MWQAVGCEAVRQRKRLELRYDGYVRVVEVHVVGRSTEGHDLMRVWQVRGGSRSEPVGWKLLRLDEALSAHVLDEQAQVPRVGYKRDDKAMATYYCRI